MRATLLAVAAAACWVGCIEVPEQGGSVVVLEGGAIGTADFDNDTLVRDVELVHGEVPEPLSLGAAHAAWPGRELDELGSSVELFVEVKSSGPLLVCDALPNGMKVFDDDGEVVAEEPLMLLRGSSGYAVSVGEVVESANDSCVAPGETAWLYQLLNQTPLERVARLELGDMIFIADQARPPLARLVPESYSATLTNGLVVTLQNRGSATARLTSATAIVLADDGRPLTLLEMLPADESNALVDEVVVDPRRRARAALPMIFFGLASRVQVTPHYQDE